MEFKPPVVDAIPDRANRIELTALTIGAGVLAAGVAAGLGWKYRDRISDYVNRVTHNETFLRLARVTVSTALDLLTLRKTQDDSGEPTGATSSEKMEKTLPVIAVANDIRIRENLEFPHDVPFCDSKLSIGIFRTETSAGSQAAADSVSEDLQVQPFHNVDEVQGQHIVADILQTALDNSDSTTSAVVTRLFQNRSGETYAAMAISGKGAIQLVRKGTDDTVRSSPIEFSDSTYSSIATHTKTLKPGDKLVHTFSNVVDNVSQAKIEEFATDQAPADTAEKIVDSAEKNDIRVPDVPGRSQDKTVAILWYLGEKPGK